MAQARGRPRSLVVVLVLGLAVGVPFLLRAFAPSTGAASQLAPESSSDGVRAAAQSDRTVSHGGCRVADVSAGAHGASIEPAKVVPSFGGLRYEPELARVPFGTQDLVLRRVERFDARTIVIEARDVSTDATLPGAQLTVFDDDARAGAGMSIVKRPGPGRLETTSFVRPGTRLAVWSEEYAPRFMSLPPAGATAEGPLVVHMEGERLGREYGGWCLAPYSDRARSVWPAAGQRGRPGSGERRAG